MSDDEDLIFVNDAGDRLTTPDQSKWMATCKLDGCTWRGEIVDSADECDHTFAAHLAEQHPEAECIGVDLSNPPS